MENNFEGNTYNISVFVNSKKNPASLSQANTHVGWNKNHGNCSVTIICVIMKIQGHIQQSLT